MKKQSCKKYVIAYLVSVALFTFGVLTITVLWSLFALFPVFLIAGIVLFVGTTMFLIINKLKTVKKRNVFYICGYIVGVAMIIGGLYRSYWVENYGVYTGFMGGLGEYLFGLFIAGLGAVIAICLTVVAVAKNKNRKNKH